jgi:hypothetical protein
LFDFTPGGANVSRFAVNANNHLELYTTQEGYYLNHHVDLPKVCR